MLYKVRNIELVVGRCLCNRDNALSHTAPPVVWLGVRLVARCCIFVSFSMIVSCALWHMPTRSQGTFSDQSGYFTLILGVSLVRTFSNA